MKKKFISPLKRAWPRKSTNQKIDLPPIFNLLLSTSYDASHSLPRYFIIFLSAVFMLNSFRSRGKISMKVCLEWKTIYFTKREVWLSARRLTFNWYPWIITDHNFALKSNLVFFVYSVVAEWNEHSHHLL